MPFRVQCLSFQVYHRCFMLSAISYERRGSCPQLVSCSFVLRLSGGDVFLYIQVHTTKGDSLILPPDRVPFTSSGLILRPTGLFDPEGPQYTPSLIMLAPINARFLTHLDCMPSLARTALRLLYEVRAISRMYTVARPWWPGALPSLKFLIPCSVIITTFFGGGGPLSLVLAVPVPPALVGMD